MFADILPPPVFTIFGAYGWAPTVELTVQVRRKACRRTAAGETCHKACESGCGRDRYRDMGLRRGSRVDRTANV